VEETVFAVLFLYKVVIVVRIDIPKEVQKAWAGMDCLAWSSIVPDEGCCWQVSRALQCYGRRPRTRLRAFHRYDGMPLVSAI